MRHRLATKAGRARYALRKQTVEPVFGISESVLGFRRFLMRGLDKVQIEWTLVCLAWNLERMAVLRPQCTAELVPGLMLSAACVPYVYVRCRLDPSVGPPAPEAEGRMPLMGKLRLLRSLALPLLVVLLVPGTI
jgi:hypothetical protein